MHSPPSLKQAMTPFPHSVALPLPLDPAAKRALTVADVYVADAYVVDLDEPLETDYQIWGHSTDFLKIGFIVATN
jgi:hypothetical protein